MPTDPCGLVDNTSSSLQLALSHASTPEILHPKYEYKCVQNIRSTGTHTGLRDSERLSAECETQQKAAQQSVCVFTCRHVNTDSKPFQVVREG